MTNLPTVSQNAPYVWTAECDAQGNPITSTNPQNVNISEINGTPAVVPSLGQNTSANSLSTVPSLDAVADQDGNLITNVQAVSLNLLSAGGPVDSTGKPQQAAFDRVKSWQGSGVGGSTANITATVAGDTALAFGSAPKTIMPGQKIQLSVGSGFPVETVIVDPTYVPSSTLTSIPLLYPVVNASSTTAQWDIYAARPPTGAFLPTNLLPVLLAGVNPSNEQPLINFMATLDNKSAQNYLEFVQGGINAGGTVDRYHNNQDNVSLAASAARTSTLTGSDQTNYNGRGVIVVVDVTVLTATGTLTTEIDFKDPISGKYISLLTASSAIAATGTYTYMVYPGTSTTVTNTGITQSSAMVLPRTWRVVVTAGNAVSITYSVGGMVIV